MDHPTFTLQFDNDSSQDQNNIQEAISHENMTTKSAGHNADYNLRPNETVSLNHNRCSSKLKYSPTGSQIGDNVASSTGCSSDQTCRADEIMDNVSSSHGSEITKYVNYSEMLQDLGQESKMVLLQYSHVFGECEVYEQQACQAVTDLTAHAQLLLQNLNDKKKILCSRINSISEALKQEC